MKENKDGGTSLTAGASVSVSSSDQLSHAAPEINLWLDDLRDPASFGCAGWTWAKTVAECVALLRSHVVVNASLDHDLGACADCYRAAGVEYTGDFSRDWAAWLCAHEGQVAPNCRHVGTGYDLERTGHWPRNKPRVHSANPSGAARMRQAIEHSFVGSGNQATKEHTDATRRSAAQK
jgi:hypothetical protein